MSKEEERLKKRIKDQQALQDQERRKKKKSINELMEEEKPLNLGTYDFWCENCQEDFEAPCHKTRHRLYGDTVAVWRGRCPECGDEAIRHITHRDEDKYYQRSTRIRRQRREFAHELLQAGDYGFRTHWGEPYAEFNERMQKQEEEKIKRQLGEGLKRFV